MRAQRRISMIPDEQKVFVRLRYSIPTDFSDWKRCEATYPESVKSKWAWRCAADVEHLATKGHHPEAEECIRIAKLYRDGKATIKELDKAWRDVPYADTASYAASYAAASCATSASYHAATSAINREKKWKLYIKWLIEELCEYESTHQYRILIITVAKNHK